MKALTPVGLPDPTHSHYDEETGRFVTHEHVHAGPHRHEARHGRTGTVTVNGPGNYSPKAVK